MLEGPFEAMRLDSELRRELAAGERVLWQERPDPRRLWSAFLIWIFAVPWTAFSLGWTGIALVGYLYGFGMDAQTDVRWWGWIAPLFGLPFVAAGFWMLSRPIAVLIDGRHTVHALTSERLVTLTAGKRRKVKSVSLRKLGAVTRKERADGSGNLTVETGSSVDSEGDRITDKFEIYGVPNVARLERLINENRREHG